MRYVAAIALVLAFVQCGLAQGGPNNPFDELVRVRSRMVVLKNVRIIGGTGSAPKDDQTITLIGDRIGSITPAASAVIPAGAQVLELSGYTVLPGLVGMHNHIFF